MPAETPKARDPGEYAWPAEGSRDDAGHGAWRRVGVWGPTSLLLVVVGAAARPGTLSRGISVPYGPFVRVYIEAALASLGVLIVTGAGLLAWSLASHPRTKKHPDEIPHVVPPVQAPRWQKPAAIAIPLLLLAAGIAGGLSMPHGRPPAASGGLRGLQPPAGPVLGEPVATRGSSGIDWAVIGILVVAALAVGLLAVSGWHLLVRRQRRPAGLPTGVLRVAGAAGTAELLAEPDPRRAVIAAYGAMVASFTHQGSPRYPPEVPFEYLSRVLKSLGAPEAPSTRLTELFEQAGFSHHPTSESARTEALEALDNLARGPARAR